MMLVPKEEKEARLAVIMKSISKLIASAKRLRLP